MTPITGPKAWRGDDLARETSWIVTLTDAEIADVDRALAAAQGHRPAARPRSTASTSRSPSCGRAWSRRWPRCTTAAASWCCAACRSQRYSDDDVGLDLLGHGPLPRAGRSTRTPRATCSATSTTTAGPTATSTCAATRPTPTCPITPTPATWWACSACAGRSRAGSAASSARSPCTTRSWPSIPSTSALLYNGFYYIRREAALTERGVSERPIPVFGYQDGW